MSFANLQTFPCWVWASMAVLTKRGFPDTGCIVAGIDVDFLAEVEALGGAGVLRVCSYRYQAFTLLLLGAA